MRGLHAEVSGVRPGIRAEETLVRPLCVCVRVRYLCVRARATPAPARDSRAGARRCGGCAKAHEGTSYYKSWAKRFKPGSKEAVAAVAAAAAAAAAAAGPTGMPRTRRSCLLFNPAHHSNSFDDVGNS